MGTVIHIFRSLCISVATIYVQNSTGGVKMTLLGVATSKAAFKEAVKWYAEDLCIVNPHIIHLYRDLLYKHAIWQVRRGPCPGAGATLALGAAAPPALSRPRRQAVNTSYSQHC